MERIANSTHFGIGVLPDSQRATVAREIPKAEARPVCVRPASVRSVTRVSGCKPSMILSSAGAFTFIAGGVDAGSGASLLFADDSVNCAAKKSMRAGSLESVAGGGGFVEGGPGRLAGEAGEKAVCCFHEQNVAHCYTIASNLYRIRQKNLAGVA